MTTKKVKIEYAPNTILADNLGLVFIMNPKGRGGQVFEVLHPAMMKCCQKHKEKILALWN